MLAAFIAITIYHRRQAQVQTEIKLVDTVEEPEPVEIRPLGASSRERYQKEWEELGTHFSEEPEATLRQADRLLQTIMQERGYPTGDFGPVPRDLPAEHAEVLNAYRFGHRVSVKAETDAISEEQAERAANAFGVAFENLVIKEGT